MLVGLYPVLSNWYLCSATFLLYSLSALFISRRLRSFEHGDLAYYNKRGRLTYSHLHKFHVLLSLSALLFTAIVLVFIKTDGAFRLYALAAFYCLCLPFILIPVIKVLVNIGNLRFMLRHRGKHDAIKLERSGNSQALISSVWRNTYRISKKKLFRTVWAIDEKAYFVVLDSLLRMNRLSDLFLAFEQRGAWDKYAGAFERLSKTRSRNLIQALYIALKAPNREISVSALYLLEKQKDEDLRDYSELEPLCAFLSDREKSYHILSALQVLLKTENPDALGVLKKNIDLWLALLEEESLDSSCKTLAETLAAVGDPRAIEPLVRKLESSIDKEAASALSKALGALGWVPPPDKTGASFYIHNRNWERCVKIGAPAVEPLLKAMNGADRAVKLEILRALAEIGDPEAAPGLLDYLHEGNSEEFMISVSQALLALGESGLKALVEKMRAGGATRDAIFKALALYTAEKIDPLLALLKSSSDDSRVYLFRLLKELGAPSDTDSRLRYFIALGQWDKAAEMGSIALEPLIDEMKKNEYASSIIAALGKLGDKRAVAPLVERLEDADREHDRQAAAEALLALGDPLALEPFIRTLEKERGAADYRIVNAAVSFLGKIGGARAEEALLKVARSPEEYRAYGEEAWKAMANLGNAEAREYIAESERRRAELIEENKKRMEANRIRDEREAREKKAEMERVAQRTGYRCQKCGGGVEPRNQKCPYCGVDLIFFPRK
jgi:HEAT repeat protein/DNA-directed RNA polymerase subunit RPC12/RpoP